MTDKLRAAAEMALEAMANAYDALQDGDIKGCQWILREQVTALRQALDQLPDNTKMIDKDFALNVALEALHNFADDESADGWKAIDAIGVVRKALAEPDMGIDRGAWSDVPDATKWVDELRGDEDLEESKPICYAYKNEVYGMAHGYYSTCEIYPENDTGRIPLYTALPVKSYCGGKPNYCEQDLVCRLRKRAEIRRQISTRKSVQEGKPDRIADLLEEAADRVEYLEGEWQGLTDDEIIELHKQSWVDRQAFESVAWLIDEYLEKKNAL